MNYYSNPDSSFQVTGSNLKQVKSI